MKPTIRARILFWGVLLLIGIILYSAGLSFASWQFWSVLGLTFILVVSQLFIHFSEVTAELGTLRKIVDALAQATDAEIIQWKNAVQEDYAQVLNNNPT